MTFSPACRVLAVAAVLPLALTACSAPPPSPAPAGSHNPGSAPASKPAAPSTPPSPSAYDQMTQREKAALLLMPPVTTYDEALTVLRAGVGGIFIPSWADPGLLTEPGRNLAALRNEVGRPFDVSIDFEGGRVQRFSDILGSYPSPRQMAAGGPKGVRATARQIGESLKAHGITVDFAPVLDVDGNNLEVVGDRSFSTDPATAGQLGAAFAQGLQDAGVGAVMKHYPGHGRASGDSHHETVVTPPLDQLKGFDLVPFGIAIPQAPQAGVMMGHMVVPGLGEGPSSLNPAAYAMLRQSFQGLVYTDDLAGMKAISNQHPPADAATLALTAGADVALWSVSVDINSVIDSVDAAVTDGRFARAQFDASTGRVATHLGLDN